MHAPRAPRGISPDAPREFAASGKTAASVGTPLAAENDRLLHSIPAARIALIERIARAAATGGGRRDLRQRFLRAYFHGVAEEDLAERTPRHLARAALAHLAFAARRPPGRSLVHVLNPEPKS